MFRPDLVNYYLYENGFNNEEIQKVMDLANEMGGTEGTLEGGGVSHSMRTSELKWFNRKDPKYEWLYNKIQWFIDDANEHMWHFNITGFREPIQFTTYYSHNNGKYDYHTDVGLYSSHRKISLTVQLSDPDDYEGGDLMFLRVKEPEIMTRKKGSVIVFPSYLLHRVTPVSKGTRHSLVIWVAGPPFV